MRSSLRRHPARGRDWRLRILGRAGFAVWGAPLLLTFMAVLGVPSFAAGGPLTGLGAAPTEGADSRLTLREVAPGVFVHSSYRDLEGVGPFPSNGLLLCHGGTGGLVDTSWSETATRQLLDEATARGCPVTHAVVTHSHEDRTAGLPVLLARGIRVFATVDTARLLGRQGWRPEPLAPPQVLRLGGLEVEVFYPGPAHTADNVVVHVGGARVLFGGCMIKSADAKGLGNVQDAALDRWPEAVARVAARYQSETAIVVPGHGQPGGLELLSHTTKLLSAHTVAWFQATEQALMNAIAPGDTWKLVASHTSVATHDPPEQAVSSAGWPALAGRYRLLPDGWTFTVELRGGALYGGRDPKNLRRLIPLAHNAFVLSGSLGDWIFVADEHGRTTRIVQFRKFEPLIWTRIDGDRPRR